MARRTIRGSKSAEAERNRILAYWVEHNGSAVFSKRIFNKIKESTTLISKHPHIGKPTTMKDIRVWHIEQFLLTYQLTDKNINILAIRDMRQNPLHDNS